jgi:radical SAM-linked protein
MTLFQRSSAKAGVPVAYSQGFNPHPRLAFGPALSVGIESDAEYLDMETDAFAEPQRIAADLNEALPNGIRILESRIVPKRAPSLSGSISRFVYRVAVPEERARDLDARAAAFLLRNSVLVEKDGRQKDIRQGIEAVLVPEAQSLEITLRSVGGASPRIQDVIEQLFGIGREQAALFGIRRLAMFTQSDGAWKDPMDAV